MTLRRTSRRHARAVDDQSIDALLSGRPVLGHEGVAEFVQALRISMPTQAPAASDALAAMLADGVPAAELALAPSATWTRAISWSRSTRRAVQVAGVGTGLLALTVGAAAADQLPDPVQERVASVVQTVTSVQLPRPTHPLPTPPKISPIAPSARPAEVPAGPRATPSHPEPGDRGRSEDAPGQQGRQTEDTTTGTKTEERGSERDNPPSTAPTNVRASTSPDENGSEQGAKDSGSDQASPRPTAPEPNNDRSGQGKAVGES